MKSTENSNLANKIINDFPFYPALNAFKESPEFFLGDIDLPSKHKNKWSKLMTHIIKLNKEIKKNNFEIVKEISIDLIQEEDIELDFLTSIFINYHFYCKRKLNSLEHSLYFHLFTVHRELSHHECVSVLTNICYKIGILLGKNLMIDSSVDLRHQGLYFYYKGFLNLVHGNYKDSFTFLKQSLVLRSSLKTHMCLVVNALLLNEKVKKLPFKKLKPYLKLASFVQNGNFNKFNEILEKYKPIFERDMLYGVIQKLENNVRLQNFKKMSKVYSRIKTVDLINKGITKEMLSTNEEIIHFVDPIKSSYDIYARITECGETRIKTKSMLKYKEITPISFEDLLDE
ncbi:PCI domain-containing protein [Tubulinosema ratisbonensis]|uniref:PCI domain-containing protein n=1 Tax=Tubulinosema ratisbonensis TaxID=291195 RepID=A0A437AMS7_9MICR|nr:PCI domain-containing protein [Tubulinosema ratisbonensis]